ncbi:unnamed protein product [Meganyctiphanes norvegica]|uniref:Uncharacterized protein n=1 Tax=Meganyctiphanes norvegica TaxID=48144 RepID=A0AAV2QV26_MEGNR
MDSSKKCSTQPQLFGIKDIQFQDVIDEIINMALPWGSRQDSTQYVQVVSSAGGSSKRHTTGGTHKHNTAGKLYHMKEKMACMIGNLTCMLRDLDWIVEDNTPNIPYYEKRINGLPREKQYLKAELLWGLDVCKDFSMCISPQRAKSPFMKELGTFISFFQCFRKKEIMACMKNGLKEYAVKDDYEAIDELLNYGFGMDMKMRDQMKEKMGITAFGGVMGGDLIF